MFKLGSFVCAVALLLPASGCLVSTPPPEAVLSGVWTITPADQTNLNGWHFLAIFDGSGTLTTLRARSPNHVVVDTTIINAKSQVNGDRVAITIPVAGGATTFNGTLSADGNTISGSLTRKIELPGAGVAIPAGDLTLAQTSP